MENAVRLEFEDDHTNAPALNLKLARQKLIDSVRDRRLPVAQFPTAYAAAADRWLTELFGLATNGQDHGFALLAVGGYGRNQLCPGSDLDLVLLHRRRRRVAKVADALWYAIWDQGIHLDHSVRTRREALAMARSDLKVILGLLDARVVAGDEEIGNELIESIPELWQSNAARYLPELDASVQARHKSAGELAFLLEPDLKQSSGGLRDAAALRALGTAYPQVASAIYSSALERSEETILLARVALQIRTNSSNDRLALQEQDQVAELLGATDADALMAHISQAGRTIAAASSEGWRKARDLLREASGAPAPKEHLIAPGIRQRGNQVGLIDGTSPSDDPSLLIRIALIAAERNALIDEETLDALMKQARRPQSPWSAKQRDAFIALLGTGEPLIPTVESLDQRRLFELLIPEWRAVRNLPQRNAYHRYTVDRHLLEAVVRASEHVQSVDRPDLLLLGALLHDIGKGFPGDHSEVGRDIAEQIARRMGYNDEDVRTLANIVAYHLVLPEFATRRDLDDPSTATLVAKLVGNRRTLSLLASLTEADSRATGTSAWGLWKAELVQRLVEHVGEVLDGRPVPAPTPIRPTGEQMELLQEGKLALRALGRKVTVIATDRPGLLAAVAGTLAIHGCNVLRARANEATPGMALEVFDVEPVFDELPEWPLVEADLARVLDGSLILADRLADHDRTYARGRRPGAARPTQIRATIDNFTSQLASIVEVRSPDRVGLLHDIANTFARNDLDVVSALVDTLGHEVIDTFYVRDRTGAKLLDPGRIAELRNQLEAAVNIAQ